MIQYALKCSNGHTFDSWFQSASAFDRLAGLPISVESYSLEDRDRALSPTFTRPSTLVRIQGGGEEGLGEDVVYDDLDHFALRLHLD